MVCFLFAGIVLSRPASAPAKILDTAQIDLQGKLKTGTKSEAQPVEVFQSEYCLQVNFMSTLGDLDIEVFDEISQTVFQTTGNATAGSNLTIDTHKWQQGAYILTITDDEGGIWKVNL